MSLFNIANKGFNLFGSSAPNTGGSVTASSVTAFSNKTFTDQIRSAQPDSQATDRGFDLTTRDVAGIGYPVPTLIPTTNDRTIAFDIMPKGSPSHDALNGYAWMDICSADILTTSGAVNTLRMGVLSTFVEVSSKLYNGASSLPMKLRMQTGASTFVDAIYIGTTGKKIGLNTAVPISNLHVHEDSTLTSTYIKVTNGTSGALVTDGLDIGIDSAATPNAYIIHRENASLSLWTNATQRVTINGSGRTFFGGSTSATALVHIAAGTATASTAPLKFTSGTNLTNPETGAMEYNGTNLFFTRSGTTRENVITTSSVNSVSPTNPNRTLTVVIDGSTYYIHAKTTND